MENEVKEIPRRKWSKKSKKCKFGQLRNRGPVQEVKHPNNRISREKEQEKKKNEGEKIINEIIQENFSELKEISFWVKQTNEHPVQ